MGEERCIGKKDKGNNILTTLSPDPNKCTAEEMRDRDIDFRFLILIYINMMIFIKISRTTVVYLFFEKYSQRAGSICIYIFFFFQ